MHQKRNVLSNEFDQAPKTHDAWYWERVNEMRSDMIEAMNSVNIPNIHSNYLDQAPKTREAWYQKVLDSLSDEINECMDSYILRWNDTLCNWMNDNQDNMPMKAILELKPWEKLSFEVKREKVGVWIQVTAWHPAFAWDFPNFMHNLYTREWPLEPWTKSLIIVVKKDNDDDKILNIHAEQLEYPWKNAMVMKWMYFFDEDVDPEKFRKITWYTDNEEKNLAS